jgi:hypothetical protein
MASETSSISFGSVSKFGKPCERFKAWCSLAILPIVVKMEDWLCGNLEIKVDIKRACFGDPLKVIKLQTDRT